MATHALNSDRWRKPTLAELMAVVACMALGMWATGPATGANRPDGSRPGDLTLAALAGMAVGTGLAIPAVLLIQWARRGRESWPRPGEFFGTSIAIPWFAVAFLAKIGAADAAWGLLIPTLMWSLLAGVLSPLTFLVYLLHPGLRRSMAWTEYLGFASSAPILPFALDIMSALGSM